MWDFASPSFLFVGQQRGVENQKVWAGFQEQKKKKKVNWGGKKDKKTKCCENFSLFCISTLPGGSVAPPFYFSVTI